MRPNHADKKGAGKSAEEIRRTIQRKRERERVLQKEARSYALDCRSADVLYQQEEEAR